MSDKKTMTVDGEVVEFDAGDTILQVAARQGARIPTLCHDPRLKPVGACRTCLVEIERFEGPAPRVESYDPPLFAVDR